MDLIREGVARLAAEDRSTWSGAARADRLLELRAESERLEAEVIRCTAAWDAVQAWAEDSALGPASWLAFRTGMTDADASRLVRSARLVRDHDRTARALETGEILVSHVHALAAAARDRAALYLDHEDTLIDAATKVEARDFGKVARRWRELADDEESRRDAAFAFARRGLQISETTGGGLLGGFLDPEATATVIDALDALEPPDPANVPEVPRSLAQRRADAFVLMCQRSLGGNLPESRPIAGVEVVVDHDTLARHPTGELDALRCEIEGFGPIARITAERLVCDCALARVVVKGRSEIVDYGRRTRTIPRRLRRLIRLRDQHCQYPGCRAPAAWCDVHHLIHWLRGGETNLENCALLCRRHHVACHEGGWKLARGPDGTMKVAFDPAGLALAA
jgi:hypothetical protein